MRCVSTLKKKFKEAAASLKRVRDMLTQGGHDADALLPEIDVAWIPRE